MSYLEQTKAIYDEIVQNRRHLHKNPEVGYELKETSAYVKERLKSYGYTEFNDILDYGFTVDVGQTGGKTFLLRADMDALPMDERSELDFSSENEGMAHTCGHDVHTSMMLATAKVLKENEDKLEGTVRIEFQPAEELLTGSESMIENGLLEGVDAALAGHVQPLSDPGVYFNEGISLAGANNYSIKVKGAGAHGAMPYTGVDPVFVATQIINAFQGLISREVSFSKSATITTGGFQSPGSRNVIPDYVDLEGTMRTFDDETRSYLKERMPEVAEGIAKVFRAEIEFEWLSDVPALYNDPELTQKVRGYAEEIFEGEFAVDSFEPMQASEDFAFVSTEVPTNYFFIGTAVEGKERYAVHDPRVVFNEEVMPYGAALFAETAERWLRENK